MSNESEQFSVALLQPNGNRLVSAVILDGSESDDCSMVLTWDRERLESTAEDFFEAFCSIRRQLEKFGLLPVCYGAHLHAYPSGMSRSMGGGRRLYRLTLGKQALTEDLVELFDAGDDVIPSTVDDQQRFFDDWVCSLGNNGRRPHTQKP